MIWEYACLGGWVGDVKMILRLVLVQLTLKTGELGLSLAISDPSKMSPTSSIPII